MNNGLLIFKKPLLQIVAMMMTKVSDLNYVLNHNQKRILDQKWLTAFL